MKIDTQAYHRIPIRECAEPLVRLAPRPGLRLFDQTRLPPRPRTDGIYLRQTAAEKLYRAGQRLLEITDGDFELYIRDGYRLMEAQRMDWNEGMEVLLREIGNEDRALAAALTLYSDPRGFDENDPRTWTLNTPIHATGGAVDTFILSRRNPRISDWIIIHDYPDRIAHYETDYFEKKNRLTPAEEMVRNNRRILLGVMASEGFTNYPREPWHFDYGDQMWGLLTDRTAIYGYAKL